jgi:hypothetical protein
MFGNRLEGGLRIRSGMPTAKLRLTVPEGVWIGDLSRSYPAATLRVLAALADDDGGVGLVEVTGEDPNSVCESVRAYSEVTAVEVFTADEDEALLQFETTSPVLLLPAQGSGVPLELPFDICDGEAVWEVTAPGDRLSTLGEQLDAFDIPFEVEWVQQSIDDDQLLTDRQRELLTAAVEAGYYDTPRRCSLTDLADYLDVAKSTCSETLHRAESKVVKQYLQTLVSARDEGPLVSV